jgi:hypothetical protein
MSYPEPPPSDYDISTLPPLTAPTSELRLSIADEKRVTYVGLGGFALGAILGASHAGSGAALRFRAENAHRLPDSTKGWYLYHKSKNYNVMHAALREAAKMGVKIGFWAGGFFWLEDMIDAARRGRKDFVSTTLTGLVIGGSFSAWSGFSVLAKLF